MSGFSSFDLSPSTLDAIAALGWEEPTPVQRAVIPLLMSGRDVVAQAETGSGKTAAYGIPLVEAHREGPGIRVLVVVPTRELAQQVAEVLSTLGSGRGFSAFPVYGGTRVEEMAAELARARPTCLVATPGRLLDLLDREEIRLLGVETVILDEADRMLEMGFLDDAARILHLTRNRKLTALFSATIPPQVEMLASQHLNNAEVVRIEAEQENIQHFRINVDKEEKLPALAALLKKERPERALVFIRTRDFTDRVTRALRAAGVLADPLHGERTQAQREHVVDLLRRGATHVVVATDVAARGIDVPEMTHVINFDLPDDWNVYVHRAGRTGRAGRPGRVFSFVTPEEKRDRLGIERVLGREMTPYRLGPLPRFEEPPPPRAPRKGPPTEKQKAEARARFAKAGAAAPPKKAAPGAPAKKPAPGGAARRAPAGPKAPPRKPGPAKGPGKAQGGGKPKGPPRRGGGERKPR